MLRCVTRATMLALAFAAAVPAVHAQAARRFPATALRGEIVIQQPPALLLNRQFAARLAPGARIRGQNNLLVLSGELVGQRLAVNYTLDGNGNLMDVWVLTAEEFANKPWPATPQQAAAWRFNPDAQAWSKP